MKKIALAALVGLSFGFVQKLHSHLLIEAGKQFLLGGGQAGSFVVSGQNVGPVAVEVREQPSSGPSVLRGVLAPRQRARLRFAPGSTAVLLNKGARQAVLELIVRGDNKALRMTTETVAP